MKARQDAYHELLTSPLAISANVVHEYLYAMHNAKPVAFAAQIQAAQFSIEVFERYFTTIKNGILTVEVFGPITRAFNWWTGFAGTDMLAEYLPKMAERSDVRGIMLVFNSGGGTASGNDNFARAIKSISKPVVAYVQAMAASAAYYMAAAADEIVLESGTSMVGSIGTMTTFADYRGYFEQMGITITDLYATKSTRKNDEYRAALEGDFSKLINDFLDPFNENFHNAIAQLRPNAAADVYDGRVAMGKEAIRLGLADKIGDMQTATKRIGAISRTKQPAQFNMKFGSIESVLGYDLVVQEDGAHLQVVELQKLDGQLSQHAEALATANQATQQANERAQTAEQATQAANEKVAQLEQQLADAQTRIEQLKGAPGTRVKGGKEGQQAFEGEQEDATLTDFDKEMQQKFPTLFKK